MTPDREVQATSPGPGPADKPQYFDDPAVDALYQMVLVLGEEIGALREQLDSIVALHDAGTTPDRAALDAADLGEQYDAVRKAFVDRLLEPLEEMIRRESEL